jgi:hypothetical protein
VIHQVLNENLPAAKHRVVIGELPISAGSYLWRVKSSTSEMTLPFLKQ